MRFNIITCAIHILIFLSVVSCSETRKDPCQLLSVQEVKELDNTVAVSLWAGRGGEKKENEVCMYYTDAGDPRAMLFVWYDKNKDPEELVTKGESDPGVKIIDVQTTGQKAMASFNNEGLKLLAVRSAEGVVGMRVRKPTENDSDDFKKVVSLAEQALRNIK